MPKSRHRKKKHNRSTYQQNKPEVELNEFGEEVKVDIKNASDSSLESSSIDGRTEEHNSGLETLERTFIDQEIDIEEIQGRGEKFINDNKGLFIGAVSLFFLLFAGYFFVTRVFAPGKQAAAQEDIFRAQQYFSQDSFALALNGDGNSLGFLDIISDYNGVFKGNAQAGNLAKYYAGICYLNLKDYDNAIDYLSQYKGRDVMVSAMAQGAIGDAYMEKEQTDKGIAQYKKAAALNSNELTSPMFYLKAGMAMEQAGNYAGAKEMYEKLKDYPNSQYGRDAQKYVTRVEALTN